MSEGQVVALVVERREIWLYSSGEWSKIASSDMKINCICFTSGNEIWVGTEAARLANISGEGLHFIASFDNIPERKLWSTPWGGLPDVRSLSVSTDGTIYVNIHVGWIVQSRDEGETWTTLQKGLEKDVHHVV